MNEYLQTSEKEAQQMARDIREYCFAVGCLYCPFCIHENAEIVCRIGRPRDLWRLEGKQNVE